MVLAAGLAAGLAWAIIVPSPQPQETTPIEDEPAPVEEAPAPVIEQSGPAPIMPAPLLRPERPTPVPAETVPSETIAEPEPLIGPGPIDDGAALVSRNTEVVPEPEQVRIIGPTVELERVGYFLRGAKSELGDSIRLNVTTSLSEDTPIASVRANGWPLAHTVTHEDKYCFKENDCLFFRDLAIGLSVDALNRFAPGEALEVELINDYDTMSLTIPAYYIRGFLQRFDEAVFRPESN